MNITTTNMAANHTNAAISAALQEEMQCFVLPYGGIGFAFHCITYWIVFWLLVDESPWCFKDLRYGKIDLGLAIIALVGGAALPIYSAIRCRHHWPLVLICIWKIFLSLMVGLTAVLTAGAIEDMWDDDDSVGAIFLYLPGVIIGLTGLGVLVRIAWFEPHIKIISGVMLGVFVLLILLFRIYIPRDPPATRTKTGETAEWVISVLLALILASGPYCDWVLGVIAGNLSGVPKWVDLLPYAYYMLVTVLPMGFR
ncbi:hypothetical protein K432DRAFT_132845 [Lepidopterella palustris CBS 459.81]|uniref:Uncharacterized protein n=1 Tax=Lepidopterella palustris CBS 459.81 TaxID=1314670 RepID=A0A8E2JC44_9PEZI|nr:hypothetical protein K432DRAFT_132845 [Lepidopterella palustris CBS 459.81]